MWICLTRHEDRSGALDGNVVQAQKRAMRGQILIAAAWLAGASSAVAADQPTICADRPGKSTAPCTVPAGHFQLETGLADWTLQKGDGERDTALVIGETTIKYGLTDHSDIELDVTPWQRTTSRAGGLHDSASGIGDLLVIYKHMLTSNGAALQVTAYSFVKVPVAKRSLGNGKWEGGLIVPIQYSIAHSPLSITIGPELHWVADADGRSHHWATTQVVSLGWQATPKLNLSGEIWGQWDLDPAGTTRQASADGAVAYLVRSDLQIDGGVNLGLNRLTPDIELYAGIAKQF